MKKLALLSLAFLLAGQAHATPAQVLLIRHAEKPESGNDLSDQGWERAKALPSLFERPEFHAHGYPVALFAQAADQAHGSKRPIETLRYVSDSLKLKINSNTSRDDFKTMVDAILSNPSYEGKFVVVCWEHKVLEDIAVAFGVSPKPSYPGDHFDRAWLLTFGSDSKPSFQNLPEHLLPDDDKQ